MTTGDYRSFYQPFRRWENQALISAMLREGHTVPSRIGRMLKYPGWDQKALTATFWEDWRAVRGSIAMDSNEAEDRAPREIPAPVDPSTFDPGDFRWALIQDNPEGFRAFCNRYWPEEPMPAHIFAEAQVCYDYEARKWKSAVIITVFPESAKSIYFARRWTMWRLCQSRNWRIGIISETQRLAADWVNEIAEILTTHEDMRADWGEWKDDKSNSWRPGHAMLKVKGAGVSVRWNVIGLGRDQQIQGMRLDEVVIDDPETPDTIMTSEDRGKVVKRIDYVIENRLSRKAVLRLIATRFDTQDIPGILSERRYRDGRPMWEHISFPALIDPVTRKPSTAPDAVSLWPENWPVERLRDKQERMTDVLFEPLFQQNPRPPGAATFDMTWIYGEEQDAHDERRGCLDRDRPAGIGADDSHWSGTKLRVFSLDPSGTAGWWAMPVADVNSHRDSADFRAVVLDIRRGKWTTQAFLEQVEAVCETYHPQFFIPESNMRADLWNGDNRDFMRLKLKYGFTVNPHRTGETNKRDLMWGVESLAQEFYDGRIRLPYGDEVARRDVMPPLLTEIYEHRKERRTIDDILMALWFMKYGWRSLYTSQPEPEVVNGGWQSVPEWARWP